MINNQKYLFPASGLDLSEMMTLVLGFLSFRSSSILGIVAHITSSSQLEDGNMFCSPGLGGGGSPNRTKVELSQQKTVAMWWR